MFFFFIGGVQPRIRRIIQSNHGPCPNCLRPLDLVELAETLEVFWIPVWRFSSREALHCGSCGYTTDPRSYEHHRRTLESATKGRSVGPGVMRNCRQCGAPVASDEWQFCPSCGSGIGGSGKPYS